MPRPNRALFLLLALASGLPAWAAAALQPYRSEAELAAVLERWRAQAQRIAEPMRRAAPMGSLGSAAVATAPAPAAAPAQAEAADRSTDNSLGRADESITNVQTAGVDEGGIVKRAGEHLVVLRRGRLFTLRVGGDQLQPVAMTDAYATGSDPRGAWYDELLVAGRTVVVVGYSYARGGTEIGLFELSPEGQLAYRATYHLRSFDYYTSRNYASRLVGRQLIFYAPTELQPWGPPPLQRFPGLRRWGGNTLPGDFERILPATRVYRSDDEFDPAQPLALHTVTRCDLDAQPLRCEASAVLGPRGRVFYVSATSVYVWTTSGPRREPWPFEGRALAAPVSAVFRLPLDGATPTALKTAGVPIDALSFLEEAGHLNVLLRENGIGEGLWGAEGHSGRGRLALLRVPLADLADGRSAARREQYRRLPGPSGGAAQNRYVGDWLLYGGGDGAWAVRFAAGGEAVALRPGHDVERIEALGGHALLVGNAGSELRFSAVRLGHATARVEGSHAVPGARQGESRTHGFFYRATGPEEGLLGLPVLGGETLGHKPAPWPQGEGAAAVVFLRHGALRFTALGALRASFDGGFDDRCKASCVDWYGNARPIFIGERVFALLGYELVEGRLAARGWGGERIEERRRISFAPPQALRGGRPNPFE